MKRKDRLPELLAPAGDFDCLVAAVEAGADAIYVGGESFGARAYAKNFNIDELARATEYCHLWGRKIYVTVNTLVYDRELSELSDYALSLYRIGVDAVISADLGVIREIKRRVPQLEIHASTQMSVHNTLGADLAYELGCERVVLAREISYDSIKRVTAECKAETEIFLHGALCVCHSGQCLMSSLVGGRSGNRGECAQPCRLPYNGGYPISLSDISLAEHVPALIESGVASLKIEGRMKSPTYVYTVTSIYRKLLDEKRCATKEELSLLASAFSRNGFTDGYFRGDKFSRMTGVRSSKDKESTKSFGEIKLEPRRKEVSARVEMRLGESSKMTLYTPDREVSVLGDIPALAEKSPLVSEDVRGRLCKMGGTPLSLSPENIELVLEDGINLSPAAINSLRREAVRAFLSCERETPSTEPYQPVRGLQNGKKFNTGLFLNPNILKSNVNKSRDFADFLDVIFLPLDKFDPTVANGVYIPPVIMENELCRVRELLIMAERAGAKYALVGNLSHIPLVRESGLYPIGDFRLNVTNSLTREAYAELGIRDLILSPELTLPMARDIGGSLIVYGRIPLMLTERCFMKESFGCDRCGKVSLTDRYGEKFPILPEYGHRNLILNSRPTYMGDKKNELSKASIRACHFIFSTETRESALAVLDSFEKGLPLDLPVRRIGRRDFGDKGKG